MRHVLYQDLDVRISCANHTENKIKKQINKLKELKYIEKLRSSTISSQKGIKLLSDNKNKLRKKHR